MSGTGATTGMITGGIRSLICKSFDYVSENLEIPRAAKRAREKRNNKWKVRYNISHGSIGSFFCFPVRSRNDQIFVHLIPKFTTRASINTLIVGKRSAGLLASAFATTDSSARGSIGAFSRKGGGGSWMIWVATFNGSAP